MNKMTGLSCDGVNVRATYAEPATPAIIPTGVTIPTALWDEVVDLLNDYSGVRDSAEGPQPNRAMSLLAQITERGL